MSSRAAKAEAAGARLSERYDEVRRFTEDLCAPLEREDYVAQSMPDASPVKWHLAHTTWFFETFVLKERDGHRPVDPAYEVLFNSYYNSVGEQFPRPRRGVLTRPTVDEVYRYRREIDDAMRRLLAGATDERTRAVVDVGLNHEQQHQELILTDLKHLLAQNPLHPVYRPALETAAVQPAPGPARWQVHAGGVVEIGHAGDGFAFDNESPRHRVYLEPFALASRLVTNGEYCQFIDDGGYRRPELWLSEGWDVVAQQSWQSPLYWERATDGWRQFTLCGQQPLAPAEPACHLSYYEADAFARWAGARLPREEEWEAVAAAEAVRGNFVEGGRLQPAAAVERGDALVQLFGEVWQWTQSAYAPYPGYRPPQGALGEYNGKFMCNQFVLRGGSCATPQSHVRATYRNFFPAGARWQFSGVRLAKDV
jgi:ergothioneine biosynthesis protein EgtB